MSQENLALIDSDDLLRQALKSAGELIDGTSEYESRGLLMMNELLKALCAGGNEYSVDLAEVWEWAKAPQPGILTLLAPYETGIVTLTQGSTSGTFGTAPSAGLGSFANRVLMLTGNSTLYRISTHTAGSASFVLDQEFLEASYASTFKAIKLEYDLVAGIERLAMPMRGPRPQFPTEENGEIQGIDKSALERDYPLHQLRIGPPTRFCIVQQLEGQITVRFDRTVGESTRVEYDYIPEAKKLVIFEFATTDVDVTANTIAEANHGLVNGQIVRLKTTSALPSPLLVNTNYYVVSAAAGTLKLATTLGGTAIDITTQGTGTHKLAVVPPIPQSYRRCLYFAAAHVIAIDKNDARTDYYFRQTQQILQSMRAEQRKKAMHPNRNRGRLIARNDGKFATVPPELRILR